MIGNYAGGKLAQNRFAILSTVISATVFHINRVPIFNSRIIDSHPKICNTPTHPSKPIISPNREISNLLFNIYYSTRIQQGDLTKGALFHLSSKHEDKFHRKRELGFIFLPPTLAK